MTEQSDVKAAAKRLIAEAAIAEREMLHMYGRGHRPDYLTVARFALEAVNDRERLLGEVERLREIVKEAWRLWADITGGRPIYPQLDGGFAVVRVSPERLAAFDALFRTSAADAAAPAVAPGASDAGDGDGEN